jgi:hypothetical protein
MVMLNLHTVTDRKLLIDIAAAQAQAKHRVEIENRTYHMGKKATAGLDYDNRLTTRLNCSATTAYAYLNLDAKKGGLQHRRSGNKYHVTERAVRDFEENS